MQKIFSLFRQSSIVLILFAVFSFSISNKAKAQTTADSVLTVTDTSVTTPNNIVVTDSSGTTTLFAGGQQSGFSGKVGVGTSSPAVKLHIYDDYKANFRLSQRVSNDSSQANIRSSNHQSHGAKSLMNRSLTQGNGQQLFGQQLLGNNGQPIDNFDISFTDEPSNDGLFNQGTVFMAAFSNLGQLNINNATTSQRFMNSVNAAQQASPCSMYSFQTPALVSNASGFGWQTPNCNGGGAYVTSMYLSPFGSLHLESGIFANGISQITANSVAPALIISNDAAQGRGLKIAAGDGVNAPHDYSIFEVDDFAGNKIVEVNGKDQILYAREIKVQATPFPADFVFSKDYKMMGLHDLENYVNANHHLPEIPSAAEQTANGINVADMQNKLLQKIEELTLIVIEQNKRIDELAKQNKH